MHGSVAGENADTVGVDADFPGNYRETASTPVSAAPS